VFFSFIFLFCIFVFGLYFWLKSREAGEKTSQRASYELYPMRLIAFGIFWFFITLTVESSIIPIADVIFEHRVYLPSVGIFISATSAMFIWINKYAISETSGWDKLKYFFIAAMVVFSSVYSILTYTRNTLWQDEVAFWKDVVTKSPNKARPYNELGRAYRNQGHFNYIYEAIEMFNTALRLDPECEDAYNNLGLAYMSLRLHEQAFIYLHYLLKLNPNNVDAHYNIGLIHMAKGNIDSARSEFETALRIDPFFDKASEELTKIYTSRNRIMNDLPHL
jgi:tetratricopeptide (TPR) repeat protein